MFHSSGYFKKNPCPFHEHGLCHRPHCHYSHKASKTRAPPKKPAFLKQRLTSTKPNPASVLNIDLSKIDDKVISDVAVAINQVSNFFGSSSENSLQSLTNQEEAKSDTIVPNYAPEKCMGAISYSPPSVELPAPSVSVSETIALSVNPVDLPKTSSKPTPHCDEATPIKLTEADVFGSPSDDEPGDSGIVMESENAMETDTKKTEGPDLLQLEAEFNKVTAVVPTSLKSEALPPEPSLRKRKCKEDDPYGSMLRKKWCAHTDGQGVREAIRITPKMATVKSNFSEMIAGTELFMGKQRTAKIKERDKSTTASRPKLAPTVNARIPTAQRQKVLDVLINEYLKMSTDPQQVYNTCLEEEKVLFDKSSSRMIYTNHATAAVRQLRERVKTFLEEQRARSDARVKQHSEQIKAGACATSREKLSAGKNKDSIGGGKLSARKNKDSIDGVKLSAGKSKDSIDGGKLSAGKNNMKKNDWQSLEAELQESLFPKEIKKHRDSKSHSHKSELKSTIKKSSSKKIFDSKSSKSVETTKSELNTSKFYSKTCSPTKPLANPTVNSDLKLDLFGASSSEDEGGAVEDPPTATPTEIEMSENDDPSLSFESALTMGSESSKNSKRKKLKTKHNKKNVRRSSMNKRKSSTTSVSVVVTKLSPTIDLTETPTDDPLFDMKLVTSGTLTHSKALDSKHTGNDTSDSTEERVCYSSVNMTSRVPMLNLTRVVHVSSSDSSPEPRSTLSDHLELKPPSPADNAVFDETQPEEQICHTIPKSPTQPLTSPTFAPPGPYINLTKIATTKKPPPDVAAIAKTMGKRPKSKLGSGKKPHPPGGRGSLTVLKKKEIVFTPEVFYKYMNKYVLSKDQLVDNGYPRPTAQVGVASINRGGATPPVIERVGENAQRHYCCRCNKPFVIYNDGQYQSLEECFYHYGRLVKSREYGEGVVSMYTCCQGQRNSDGCQWSKLHVTAGEQPTSESGYVTTTTGRSGDVCVYAVDCEMCYTTAGLQLTRVSVIDIELKVIYESLVRPSHPIVDYNTRFSGLKAEDFVSVRTTLSDVQEQLLSIVGEATILLGHSLESDLRALKVIHNRVVDTAVVFPHKKGPPYKRALKSLMTEYLHKFIQNEEGGHDSLEDSRACMELMVWRVKADLKKDSRRSRDSTRPAD